MELNELKITIIKAFQGEDYFLQGILENKDYRLLVGDYSFISLMNNYKNYAFKFPISLTESVDFDTFENMVLSEDKTKFELVENLKRVVDEIHSKINLFSLSFTERELNEIFEQDPTMLDITVQEFESTQIIEDSLSLAEQLNIDPPLYDGYIAAEGLIYDSKYNRIFNKAFRSGHIEELSISNLENIYLFNEDDFANEDSESIYFNPITIARHPNGELHIIEGQSRFDHAYMAGIKSIKSYIFDIPLELVRMLSAPEPALSLAK